MSKFQLGNQAFYESFHKAYDEKLCGRVKSYLSMDFSFINLKFLIHRISSRNIKDKHFGVIGFRKRFFLEKNETLMEKAIDLVPKLLEFLEMTNFPQLQIEAAWILNEVLKNNADLFNQDEILYFLNLLSSEYPVIVEQVE